MYYVECRSPKRALENTKPAPVKRQRKNAPVLSIEKVLSEAYDEVYKPQIKLNKNQQKTLIFFNV